MNYPAAALGAVIIPSGQTALGLQPGCRAPACSASAQQKPEVCRRRIIPHRATRLLSSSSDRFEALLSNIMHPHYISDALAPPVGSALFVREQRMKHSHGRAARAPWRRHG